MPRKTNANKASHRSCANGTLTRYSTVGVPLLVCAFLIGQETEVSYVVTEDVENQRLQH